ncbi:MAG: DUF2723 domain-containing protein [Anaerolineae bacterium]
MRNRIDVGASALLFVGMFVLYARTVTPGVLDADGGEFQTNIYRLGVSHTGYPLYFMLAKLWTLLVLVGTIAYRANLFSSFMGAVAVALLYLTLRVLVHSRVGAFFAALLFGLSRVEWSQALIPDVYTLNSFFVILVVLMAALYRMRRVSSVWFVAVYALSLTHHRTMMWFAPAVGVWLLLGEGWALFRPRRLGSLILAFLLPLLIYLYIPLRGESDVGVEYHARGFVEMILASNASVWLRFGPPGFLWSRIVDVYLPLMVEQFTPVGFGLGLLGLGGLALGRAPRGWPAALPPRQWLLFVGLAHLAETAFSIVFWVVDSEIFFIPSYLTFLFFVGVGLAFAFDWAAGLAYRQGQRLVAPLGAVGLFVLAGWLGWHNFRLDDRSWDDEADTRWQTILAQPIENGAWMVGNWESLTPLEYYQYVEGRRTDLKRDKVIIATDQLKLAPQGNVGDWIQERLGKDRSVYLTVHPTDTETLGDLAKRFELFPIASLWRVQDKDPMAPQAPGQVIGQDLVLESINTPALYHSGDFVPLTFGWLIRKGSEADYTFSLRLVDTRGLVWAKRDELSLRGQSTSQVGWSDAPARDWSAALPGVAKTETQPWLVRDGFYIPPDAPPGQYAMELQVVDVEKRTPVAVADQAWLRLAALSVTSSAQDLPLEVYQIPHPVNLVLAGTRLIGYGLSSEQPRAGDRIELQLWWEGVGDGGMPVEIALVDEHGAVTSLAHEALIPAPRPGGGLSQIIRSRHELTLPLAAGVGRGMLTVTLGGARVDLTALDLRASGRLMTAPAIQYTQKAKLGDAIEFLGYRFDRSAYKPGEPVGVTLYWQAVRSVTTSYKVFVHLLNGEGVLVAQQDGFPHGGELPTDRWLPGEYIADDYHLELPAGLPAGDYRIEVGMYASESGTRLSGVDAQGQPLAGDRILLDTPVQVAR